VKVVPGSDAQNFEFDDNIDGCSFGPLDDDPSSGTPNGDTCADLEPGAYFVIEDVPAGWRLVDIDCEGDDESDIDTDEENARVDIELAAGEDITCTFFNELEEPEPGSITIVKVVPGSDTQNFEFDDNINGCSFGPLDDDPSSGTPNSDTCDDLEPGFYFVEEDVPDGWALVDIICEGDDESDIDVDIANALVEIDLAAGEDITCTFFNEAEAEIEEEAPTATPTPIDQVQGQVATATPTPVVAVEGAISPPRTGSGGLTNGSASGWRVWLGVGLAGFGGALMLRGWTEARR
jgi:hypothetical protein